MIETAQRITESNLDERIALPKNKDELFQLSTTINELLDRLEFQITRAKQFSADASHELRTPIAIIKGTLEVLIKRERTKEEYETKIEYTLKQVDRLLQLVEQFLFLSRIESSDFESNTSSFDLKEMVITSLNRFQFLIEEKNIHINSKALHPQQSTNFREYLEIILDNILSNAIKYSPVNGCITIKSHLNDNDYHLVFEDDGIGIDLEHLEELQKRHFRVITNSSQDITGYGLGLNIAYKLASLSDTRIAIENKKEGGTRVTLLIKTNISK